MLKATIILTYGGCSFLYLQLIQFLLLVISCCWWCSINSMLRLDYLHSDSVVYMLLLERPDTALIKL